MSTLHQLGDGLNEAWNILGEGWLRQYDALAERFHQIFLSAKEHSREAMDIALDKARDEPDAAREFSAQRDEKLRRYLA